MTVTHRIHEAAVISEYELTAGANGRAMPFTIGNHISFRAPLTEPGAFGDVRLVTPCRYREVTRDNILSGERSGLDLSAGAAVVEADLCNAVLSGYEPDEAWALMEDPHSFSMRVSQSDVTESFAADDVFFVLWGEPELRYYCPEPWLGAPDALNTGRRGASLEPGDTFRWRMEVEALDRK